MGVLFRKSVLRHSDCVSTHLMILNQDVIYKNAPLAQITVLG